jgi:hypothetical protein
MSHLLYSLPNCTHARGHYKTLKSRSRFTGEYLQPIFLQTPQSWFAISGFNAGKIVKSSVS